jgi:hypothetical protein
VVLLTVVSLVACGIAAFFVLLLRSTDPANERFTYARDVQLRQWNSGDTTRAVADADAPRVALLFFGLSRSLKFTLPSIRQNVIRPLTASGYRPTIFLHTYFDAGTDAQSAEADADEWKLLEPFESSVTSQADFLSSSRCHSACCRASVLNISNP